MNKKLIYGMLAAVTLSATSCIYDGLDAPAPEDYSQVTFNLDLEGAIATRGISDGESVNKLFYSIYKVVETENGGEVVELQKFVGVDDLGRGVMDNYESGTTVTVNLAKEQTYRAVFWAQNADCAAYNTDDLANVKVSYASAANNDEKRDAFCAVTEFVAGAGVTCDVVLRRPFAQVNVGVIQSDWDEAVASGVTVKESSVVIRNAATSLNLLTGEVGPETEDVEVSYTAAAIPEETLYVETDETVEGKEAYVWLSMSYILVADHNDVAGENGMLGDESATLESAEFTFVPESGTNIVLSDGLTNIPVQRNWRTNILGTVLAGEVDFKITTDPAYYNEEVINYPIIDTKFDETTNTYYIYSAAGLQWLSEESNINGNQFSGYTVKLASNVDLKGVDWTPIGTTKTFMGTFDGCNKTISNLTVNVTEDGKSAGFFASARNVKNLKLKNVDVTGHYKAGAVVGDGLCARIENCHVDGGTITSTPNSKNDEANNVGGIVGYLSAEIVAYVKDCSVKNVTVVAYRDLGGIVGTVSSSGTPVVSGNSVENVAIVADQLIEYAESGKVANANYIVGRNLQGDKLDLSSNTVNNVTVDIWTPEPGVTYVRANNVPNNFSDNTTYKFVGKFPDEVTINCAQDKTQLFDGSQATFSNHIKIKVYRIADGIQDINTARSGDYTFRGFKTPNSIAFGANAVKSLKIEGCNSYMMYFNISNSEVTATANQIVRPVRAEDSYKRFDGGMQKDIIQVYADNYTLNLINNTIRDEKGVGNNIMVYGNYEQFQSKVNESNKWINSISATGNNIANVDVTTPLVRIFNDLTFAPVAWPEDYVIPDATKALATQLATENTLTGGSCVVEILCRANDKDDTDIQLNGNE